MAVPFPSDDDAKLVPPDQDEARLLARGIISAVTPPDGLTVLQRVLLRAVFVSMTGFEIDPAQAEPLSPEDLALAMASRNEIFRDRIVQVMLIAELVLVPLPDVVAERVKRYAAELSVDDGMIDVAREYAQGNLGLALIDFNRNGYTAGWSPDRSTSLHTSRALAEAWDMAVDDPELAQRWAELESFPAGSLGLSLAHFYRARGFSYPGLAGSAPPYLAQHDWVHVVADYGTTVESELEVFGLIGRAIPDPRGFSLLAMVIGLFETGYLPAAAGLFQADRGHLSRAGVADRLADAMRRGAMCGRDLMGIDWFSYAEWSIPDVRHDLGIVAKSAAALSAGSVGPWQAGGISPFQLRSGQALAAGQGRAYDPFGAAVSGP
ncbi:MAG: ubiquinone biosynthesis protein COQ4 [Actinomycetota bacterium]|nr:ubiquinone biosynthesis protein COQ4 [Actinomycetota bacterium]